METPGIWDKKNKIADFTWSEIADAWRAARKADFRFSDAHNQERYGNLSYWQDKQEASWLGFKLPQVDTWLKEGFKVEAMHDSIAFMPHVERRRIRNSSEGDLDYGSYLSGNELPFLTKTKVKSRPGLEMEAEVTMNANTPSSVIEAYLLWLNKVAYTIEAQGSDIAIRITCPGQGLWNSSGKVIPRITVKRSGEWLDPSSWSPILSPAGFRGFMFFAIVATADLSGHQVSYGLGRSDASGTWDVSLDANGIMRITCPDSARSFPEAEMTQKVIDLLTNRNH